MGSHAYLQHCVAAFNLQRDLTKICQDLGWYPKNLGNLVTEKYVYQAIVTKDGSITHTRPEPAKERPDEETAEVMDAEFADVSAPEPKGLTDGTDSGTNPIPEDLKGSEGIGQNEVRHPASSASSS
jgi:hypothetical protein